MEAQVNWNDIWVIIGIIAAILALIAVNAYIDKKAHKLSISLLEPNDELLVSDNNFTFKVTLVHICHETQTAIVRRLDPVDVTYKIDLKQIEAVL